MNTPLDLSNLNPHGSALTDPAKKQRQRNFIAMLMSAMITYTLRTEQLKVKPVLADVYAYFPEIDDDLDLESFKQWLRQQQQREQLQQFLDQFKMYLSTLDHACEEALGRLAEAAKEDPAIAETQDTLAAAIRDLYTPLAAAQLAQMLVGRPSAATLNQGVHPALQADVRNAHQEFVQAAAAVTPTAPPVPTPATQTVKPSAPPAQDYAPRRAPTPRPAAPQLTNDDVHEAFASFMQQHMTTATRHERAGRQEAAVFASAQARAYRTLGIHFNRSRLQYDSDTIISVAGSGFVESESVSYATAAVASGLVQLISFANSGGERSLLANSIRNTVCEEGRWAQQRTAPSPFHGNSSRRHEDDEFSSRVRHTC